MRWLVCPPFLFYKVIACNANASLRNWDYSLRGVELTFKKDEAVLWNHQSYPFISVKNNILPLLYRFK